MIERFIEAGERFSFALSTERRLEARSTPENAESTVGRLLVMQHDRCGIRNELDAMAKETCAEVVRLGGDPATVTRATVAAWNYVNRWHDVWFETRSHLTSLLLLDTSSTTSTTSGKRKPRHDWDEIFAKSLVIMQGKWSEECLNWTCRRWAAELHVPRTSFGESPAWAKIETLTLGNKIREAKIGSRTINGK